MALRPTALLLIAATLSVLPACGSREEKSPKLAEPVASRVVVGQGLGTFTQPTVSNNGLAMHAANAGQGQVALSFENQGTEPVVISPLHIGVIVGTNPATDLVLLNPNNADLSAFGEERLLPGATTVVMFRLIGFSNAAGFRVVYRNPDTRTQFFVDVAEPSPSTAP